MTDYIEIGKTNNISQGIMTSVKAAGKDILIEIGRAHV